MCCLAAGPEVCACVRVCVSIKVLPTCAHCTYTCEWMHVAAAHVSELGIDWVGTQRERLVCVAGLQSSYYVRRNEDG